MWLGLAFTKFRYLTDFQKTNKCNSCFVTNYIKYSSSKILLFGRLIIVSINTLSLLKMTKWQAHVTHMAKP